MCRRFVTIIVAACVATLGVTALVPATASAASGGSNCVTKKEFRKIKHGQSYAKVKRITGAKGKVTAEY